jgi:hypothetical protein
VNITVGGGSKAMGDNISVSFYLLSPSGTGSRNYIGGSPGSVQFYNYTSAGVPNTSPFATGVIANLTYNTTVRAVVTWSPSTITGNYNLYANVTASNEFSGDYRNGPNVVTMAISIGPNPTTQLLEYVAIVAAVIVAILLIIVYYRRRSGKGSAKAGSGKAGLERSKRSAADDDDEDDDK